MVCKLWMSVVGVYNNRNLTAICHFELAISVEKLEVEHQ